MSFHVQLANAVELQGHAALLVSGIILVKNTLGSSLIDSLNCDFVSALGLGAIAFCGSDLELLESSLQCGLVSLVASGTSLAHENALLGRLNIRQTKHLLQMGNQRQKEKSTVQNGILAKNSRKCKHFFDIFSVFLQIAKLCGHPYYQAQYLVIIQFFGVICLKRCFRLQFVYNAFKHWPNLLGIL